jgi:hypothetical protein
MTISQVTTPIDHGPYQRYGFRHHVTYNVYDPPFAISTTLLAASSNPSKASNPSPLSAMIF